MRAPGSVPRLLLLSLLAALHPAQVGAGRVPRPTGLGGPGRGGSRQQERPRAPPGLPRGRCRSRGGAGLEEVAEEQHRAAPLKSPRWAEPGGPAALRELTPCQPPPGAVPPPNKVRRGRGSRGTAGSPPAARSAVRVNVPPAAPLGCQAAPRDRVWLF